jgi:ParB family chromosome partitioning protein
VSQKFPLQAIQIGERRRKDMGDIDALARSIGDVGLLHPVVVTPKGDPIAGARRIEALGWQNIPVTLVDLNEIVGGEFAENVICKDFLSSEIEAIRRALARRWRRPGGGRRENVRKLSSFLVSLDPRQGRCFRLCLARLWPSQGERDSLASGRQAAL